MRANLCSNHLQDIIFQRLRNKPGSPVPYFGHAFLHCLNLSHGVDQRGSFYRHCVSSSSPIHHGEIRLKGYAVDIMGGPFLGSYFTPVRPKFPNAVAVGYIVVFVCYFLIVISLVRHRKIRRQLTSTETNSHTEVRIAITLAIVIAVFTASWFPLIVTFICTVKRYGIASMWIRTLALSNSAMNFVIYGSRMQSFREGFVTICRKIFGFFPLKFSRTVTYNVN